MKRIGKQRRDMSMPNAALIGLGSSLLLSVMIVGIVAVLISNENLSFNTMTFAIPVIQFVATLAGCAIGASLVRDNKIAASGAICAIYYLLLICVSGLFMDGISGKFWIGLIATVAGYLCAVLLCTREKTTAKRVKRRKAYS